MSNCVKWDDRETAAACSAWAAPVRPASDWVPAHGLSGCDEYYDADSANRASVVIVMPTDPNAQSVTVQDAAYVIADIQSNAGRIPA